MGQATGELAAITANGQPPKAADAIALLSDHAAAPATTWANGHVALAWTGAAEVAVSDDLLVAVDGRLDNRAELAKRFGISPQAPAAQVLAAAWRALGEGSIDLFVGDLAVIVIECASGRLHAFRDICGGRVLHVASHHGRSMVATEWLPLLRQLPTRQPDPEWFAGGLIGRPLEPASTPYIGVQQVLPGHAASPGPSGWRQVRRAHWHVPVLRDRRPGAYADRFRELFDEAVSCRIRESAHLGVALSGGLDSTSVMVTAAAVRPDLNRTALCLPMREEEGDERSIQQLIAERSRSRLTWVDFVQSGPFGPDGPEALFERLGAPPTVVNWYLGQALADSARGTGIDVALDGEDGDGCLMGTYMWMADLIATGRWLRWRRETRLLRDRGMFTDRAMLRSSIQFAAPPRLRLAMERRRNGGDFQHTPPIIAPTLRNSLDIEERLAPGIPFESWHPGRAFRMTQRAVGRVEHLAMVFSSLSEPWRRNGVALTHPWSDRRVMSFCMGLPWEHVCSAAGEYKVVLRQAMSQRLPHQVLSARSKANISEATRNAVRGRDLPYVKEGLRMARKQPEWFQPDVVDTLENSFDSGGVEGMAVRIATFAWWLRWCGVA